MNNQHLQQIIDNYITRFVELNAPGNEEYYKWQIIWQFRPMMDEALAAKDEDFSTKLYSVKKLTSNLIDSYTQPFNGLVEFSKKEPATVRTMFTELFQVAGEDIKKKQPAIQGFLNKSHQLRDKYFPDSYLFNDDLHSVTGYLFLYDPNHNYLYKATHCRDFADCIEFYDDWGYGENTRLDVFYKMCDTALAAVKQNKALMATDASRFVIDSEHMHPDTEKHILLFDLIFCCSTYGLFQGINFVTPKSSERQLMQERKEKARKLAETLATAKQKLAELDEAKSFVASVFQPGTVIRHKTFGMGTISEVSDTAFTAQFPSVGDKSLGLATCVANALISVEDAETMVKLNCYRDILKQDQRIRDAAYWAEKAFLPYAEYLE
ncbi:MAG: hypothetical protein K5663_07770 [Clostridiales bacterium]|nr:hypothetical protein [Clostridiales bacterium]